MTGWDDRGAEQGGEIGGGDWSGGSVSCTDLFVGVCSPLLTVLFEFDTDSSLPLEQDPGSDGPTLHLEVRSESLNSVKVESLAVEIFEVSLKLARENVSVCG